MATAHARAEAKYKAGVAQAQQEAQALRSELVTAREAWEQLEADVHSADANVEVVQRLAEQATRNDEIDQTLHRLHGMLDRLCWHGQPKPS